GAQPPTRSTGLHRGGWGGAGWTPRGRPCPLGPPRLQSPGACASSLRLGSTSRSTRTLRHSDWRVLAPHRTLIGGPALSLCEGVRLRSFSSPHAWRGRTPAAGLRFSWALQCRRWSSSPRFWFRCTPCPRPGSGMFSRAQVKRILQRVPGKQRLGVYRFLPFFFVLGATMEWIMIKLRVGQETFYDVYRRKASERQYQRRLEGASETELQPSIK
uniref:Small integral membrane protein 4 n=2 Tax=Suricata suricatta TaxID=37032 RepID=A0A673TWL4_SURSU